MTAGKLGESQNHSNWPVVCQSNRGDRNGEATAMCSCLVVNVILSHHSPGSLYHSFLYHFSDFSFLSNHRPLPHSHISHRTFIDFLAFSGSSFRFFAFVLFFPFRLIVSTLVTDSKHRIHWQFFIIVKRSSESTKIEFCLQFQITKP